MEPLVSLVTGGWSGRGASSAGAALSSSHSDPNEHRKFLEFTGEIRVLCLPRFIGCCSWCDLTNTFITRCSSSLLKIHQISSFHVCQYGQDWALMLKYAMFNETDTERWSRVTRSCETHMYGQWSVDCFGKGNNNSALKWVVSVHWKTEFLSPNNMFEPCCS